MNNLYDKLMELLSKNVVINNKTITNILTNTLDINNNIIDL